MPPLKNRRWLSNIEIAFMLKTTGNAKESVVFLSEHTGPNVFVNTEETKKKWQRNWQATVNLQLL